MAEIYLIRHGQASFGKFNYDKLSALGLEQSQCLNSFFQQRLTGKPVAVMHGEMLRHTETMDAGIKGLQNISGKTLIKGFNEFDSQDVIKAAHPKFANKLVLGAYLKLQKNPGKAFQELFETAISRWLSGEYDNYEESWVDFQQRCWHAFEEAMLKTDKGTGIVFTSGGPIAAILQHILALSDEKTFDLNWSIMNASATKILFTQQGGKVNLSGFNEVSHLYKNQNLISYR